MQEFKHMIYLEYLVHSLDSINSNLKVLTSSPFLFENDIDEVQNLLYSAQSSTLDITDAYYWIDVNGRIVTSSKIYQTDRANAILDIQNQPFFLNPKKTLAPYYTYSITSKGSPSSFLYISYPLVKQQIVKYQNNTYNAKQIFDGVTGSSNRCKIIRCISSK